MTYDDAAAIWDFILARLREPLTVVGGSVVLTNIGTITAVERAPREYRNPRSGESVGTRAVLSHRFQPSRKLREQIKETP